MEVLTIQTNWQSGATVSYTDGPIETAIFKSHFGFIMLYPDDRKRTIPLTRIHPDTIHIQG